ncbi:MAG: hypothetical protein HYT77_01850 [Deltaproteobacteria bacterium]|nr:hypothetical protein [Deltaproteobacteria bacterium]
MSKVKCTPQGHHGTGAQTGSCDAQRAIKRDRVVDYKERIAYRTARCDSGDSYSCGAKSALKVELTARHEAVTDASRLRPGDRAIRENRNGLYTSEAYNRGVVVADSEGQCGSYTNVVAFRPDSFVVPGAYECILPSTLQSEDRLRRSIAALKKLIPEKD